MKINRNMSAVIANNQLLRTENKLKSTMLRLSSGYKINSAEDNPAGMAISNKMKAQIDALDKAQSNAADAKNTIEIADGALNEVSSILQRIRELSVQAANGTNADSDKQAAQDEIEKLTEEVDRISGATEYNTKVLLDGSSDSRVYTREVDAAGNAKLSNDSYRVYTLLGDGEIQEGQIWEAAMWAGFKKLDNLVVIVDNNNLQIDGSIDAVCSPYPIDKKFEAFNFHTININGNDFDEIRAAFAEARATKGMPTAIIAKTLKGKGVSFMENAVDWHGKAPNDDEYKIAMEDLEKAGAALCQN